MQATTSKILVVTSPLGSKDIPGTLTWAIYQANYQGAEINLINFNIPNVTAETEILLTEQLFIGRPTIIDATTQPGYNGQPLLRINGAGLSTCFNIVPPGGGGSTIKGFRIVNYGGVGINIAAGADGNTIANNQIGFQPLPVASRFFPTQISSGATQSRELPPLSAFRVATTASIITRSGRILRARRKSATLPPV